MTRILVERGEVIKLARLLSVARKTVGEALSGQTRETDLIKKIRKMALLRGGVEKQTIKQSTK